MTAAFRKLLLGKHPFIPSRMSYKRTVLTSQLSIVTIIICLVFAIMDFAQSKFNGIPVQLACGVIAGISLLLNQSGKHTAAKVLLILTVNVTVFLFSESEPLEIGLYIFFIVSNIGTIAVFGSEQRKFAIAFMSLSMILFLLSLFFDVITLNKTAPSHDYVLYNILANFLISFVSSSLIIYFLINLNDRSEKALRENEKQMMVKNIELTKLNTELDKFMYSTSHDLRSPISSVLGLIQLAKMSNDPKEMKGYMDMMEGRLASLNKFIKDISDYSRNARTDINRQNVSLLKVIHEIVESLRYYPGAEKIKVHMDVDSNLEIVTDPTRLQVILSNLLSNSFKYLDPYKESPFVRVSAQLNSTHIHLAVEDNGMGIPENFLPKIFDMFFQAHEKSEGSGLGLYIVKEAVTKLNGTIEAKSKLEVGSRFLVSLPVGEN